MNELQVIRRELAAQHRHAREMAASLMSDSGMTTIASSDSYNIYLSWIIDLESRRAHSHLERLRSRSELSDPDGAVIERCAREFEMLSSEGALAPPTATPQVPALGLLRDGLTRKAHVITRLAALVEELETVAASRYGLDDWRRTAHIDADSILEERRLRKNALEHVHGRTSG